MGFAWPRPSTEPRTKRPRCWLVLTHTGRHHHPERLGQMLTFAFGCVAGKPASTDNRGVWLSSFKREMSTWNDQLMQYNTILNHGTTGQNKSVDRTACTADKPQCTSGDRDIIVTIVIRANLKKGRAFVPTPRRHHQPPGFPQSGVSRGARRGTRHLGGCQHVLGSIHSAHGRRVNSDD